jgi:hypothetical protein
VTGQDDLAASIAERVIEALGVSTVPASWPAEVGDLIRNAAGSGAFIQRSLINLGPYQLVADWTANPDGTMRLQMFNHVNQPFWLGTFRPGPAIPRADRLLRLWRGRPTPGNPCSSSPAARRAAARAI